MLEKTVWEFSFDINIEKLKIFYAKKSYTHAYDEIRKFLEEKGFDNKEVKQGSCYFTTKEYTSDYAKNVIRAMFMELPWTAKCLKGTLTKRSNDIFIFDEIVDALVKTSRYQKTLNSYYENLGVVNPLKVEQTKSPLESQLLKAKEKVDQQKHNNRAHERKEKYR